LDFFGRMMGRSKNFTVLHGTRTPGEHLEHIGMRTCGAKIRQISETGPVIKGLVTSLLADELENDRGKSVVYACGPRAMLKKVAEMTEGKNECYVFLEEIMACGTHSCKGCAVPLKEGGFLHACHDGPVVDASIIDWKKFAPDTSESRCHFRREKNQVKILASC
jgi:dihydroorotate dehydrogenase electron transfer subunit